MTLESSLTNAAAFRAAAIQMRATGEMAADWETAERLTAESAAQGAKLVVIPELFYSWGTMQTLVDMAEPIPGPASERLSALAKRHKITLVGGSFPERQAGAAKPFNTCLVFGPDGMLLGRYRKRHLFEIDVPNKVSGCEADWLAAGEGPAVIETPVGKIGIAVCFDLRFPELFRALYDQGAQIIIVPSAFSYPTGEAHWDVLLRARAIETESYVVAANQWGTAPGAFLAYGHSQIIDPWGIQLATTGETESIVVAEIDLARVAEIRRNLPLKHLDH